jgi:hypothetical protein
MSQWSNGFNQQNNQNGQGYGANQQGFDQFNQQGNIVSQNNYNQPQQQNVLMSNQNFNFNNTGVSTDAFNTCNQGIANGFGAMFFNMRDTTVQRSNVPVRQSTSKHAPVALTTLLFIGGIIVAIIGFNSFLTVGSFLALIFGSYFLYFLISVCCSDIRGYVTNLKAFDDYKRTFDNMVNGKGYF